MYLFAEVHFLCPNFIRWSSLCRDPKLRLCKKEGGKLSFRRSDLFGECGKILTGGAETMRVKITLACTECKRRNYVSKKNKKNDPDRLEMKKHCRFCNKHTMHKETK